MALLLLHFLCIDTNQNDGQMDIFIISFRSLQTDRNAPYENDQNQCQYVV